jgi:cytochrome c-type biogenesis protein CcmF
MTVLGYWVVVVAFVASLAATVLYYRAATTGRNALVKPRRWLLVSALSIVFASLLLWLQLFQHDFTNGYVYSYSSSDLPLHYLLSSFWAGQEGSFLFWALCAVAISVVLRRYTTRTKTEAPVMAVYMGVQTFLILLLVAKTPFHYLWEKFANVPLGTIPADGSGLNPLLQNFWMAIHPPVMFIGFAAMAVPFSFAVTGLWKRNYSLLQARSFPWVLFGVFSLGAGLILGAYWAYGVLGWGGYWGWDPVENSSLVPWLTGLALLHTLIVERRSGRFVRTNLALAIVSYVLVVYSTFLTRSGILGDASVHSFTDPGTTVYSLLVLYIGSLVIAGFGLMFLRRADLRPKQPESMTVSRETLLGAGSLVLILCAIVVLFGTSLPIVSNSSVEPSFYDSATLPLGILMVLLVGFSLFVQWGTDSPAEMVKRSARSLIASVAALAILFVMGLQDVVMLVFAFAAAFALFVNVELALKTAKLGWISQGGRVAHIGLALFFLGVIATGKYSQTQHARLPLNTATEVLGYSMTYTGYTQRTDGKFAFHVIAERNGGSYALAPIMFDAGNQGIMRTPDISSFLTRDLYISPVSVEEHNHASDMETYTIPRGETVSIGDVQATFVRFAMDQHGTEAMMQGTGGMAIGSVLEVTNGSERETITPVAVYRENSTPIYQASPSRLINADVKLLAMNVGTSSTPSTITVGVMRNDVHDHDVHDALVVEASTKPFMSMLWGGTVLIMLGVVLSIAKRTKEE